MTGVTHGADTERLTTIAADLGRSAEQARGLGTAGGGMFAVLGDVWQGPDLDDFGRQWETAGRALAATADHLDAYATRLRAQADDQTEASTPSDKQRGGGDGGGAGGGGSDSGGKIGAALGDIARTLGNLPEGLDADDPVVEELLATPEGREWLQWLGDNDIEVYLYNGPNEYHPGQDTIYLNSRADVTSLIHEATHAQWDVAGRDPGITEVGRDEYVNAQIDGEVAAMVSEVEYMLATDASLAQTNDQSYWSYTEAYDAAIADGASPEEARADGAAAIRELFTDGFYLVGNEDEDVTYMEYYGEAWDERN